MNENWSDYFTRPTHVKVRRATEIEVVETKLGMHPYEETAHPGDFIVKTSNGVQRVWKEKEFHEHFRKGLVP